MTNKKLTKNQLDALARGRAIRKQNIKNQQSGGNIDMFFQKLDNFWEEADLKNPDSIYYPDTYDNIDWNHMIKWVSGTWGTFTWNCPQPWGFIFMAYKILTQGMLSMMQSNAMSNMLRLDIADICEEDKQRFDQIIDQFIDEYLDNEILYIGRKDDAPNYNTWGIYREGINKVNMYDFFSKHLNINRRKVRHFLFKTLKEIVETRCGLVTQARDGIDTRRSEEMPMFSDIVFTPTRNAPGGLLSVELNTIWDNLSQLTGWNTGGRWYAGHEPRERQERYIQLNTRMIDMFEHIWERLIVPSMKKVIANSSDPYTEFGIVNAIVVPAAEDTHEMTFKNLPIEIIAEHERKILEKKYLDKWGPYGIKLIDRKTRVSLDQWQKSFIDSYYKGVAPPGIWSEPPEPKAVTRMKERAARDSLKKRSQISRTGSSYYSDTTTSDDDE